MPFLDPLMNKFGCKPDGDDLLHGKKVVAKCNHVAGRWEITPEGQKLIDSLPPEEPAAEDKKLQPHQIAMQNRNIPIAGVTAPSADVLFEG